MAAGDALAVFLRAEAAKVFDWRSHHCMLLPADWMVCRGQPDPAADWRWVSDEAAALRVLGEGSVLTMAERTMPPADRIATDAVRRGDVGIVVVTGPDGRAEVGAISTGSRWAVRARHGIWIGRAEALAAWSVEGVDRGSDSRTLGGRSGR